MFNLLQSEYNLKLHLGKLLSRSTFFFKKMYLYKLNKYPLSIRWKDED